MAKLTFVEAALVVLRHQGLALSANEITGLAIELRLLETHGKTPTTAMRARLYTDLNRHGDASPFVLSSRGRFGLREWEGSVRPIAQDSSYLLAALAVLEKFGEPQKPQQILSAAQRLGLLPESANTHSMRARLSTELAKNAANSPLARVQRNTFALRAWLKAEGPEEYVARRFAKRLDRQNPVLAIHQQAMDNFGRFQGVRRTAPADAVRLFSLAPVVHLPRPVAEEADDWKQVITYALLRTPDSRYLAFTRGRYSAAADFLAGSLCIGFGGHVEKQDLDLFSQPDFGVVRSLHRELTEELTNNLSITGDPTVVGLLNDDSSAVGLRHIAFVYSVEINDPETSLKQLKGELSINRLQLLSLDEIHSRFHELEYWSQLAAHELLGIPIGPAAISARRSRLTPKHRLLVVSGEIGTGKSTVARILSNHTGFPVVSTRASLESMLGIRLDEANRLAFSAKAHQLVADPEETARYVQLLLGAIPTQGPGAIVDGVRHPEVIRELRQARPDLLVLHVKTPPHIAFERYRERTGLSLDMHDFRARREHLVERSLARVGLEADATLFNSGSIEDLDFAINRWVTGCAGG